MKSFWAAVKAFRGRRCQSFSMKAGIELLVVCWKKMPVAAKGETMTVGIGVP